MPSSVPPANVKLVVEFSAKSGKVSFAFVGAIICPAPPPIFVQTLLLVVASVQQ